MKNIDLLMCSLEFIESHLGEDIKTIDIAKACHCSKSTLEKLFQCVNHISVRGYIIRRRMMLAARAIAKHPEKSLLDIALEYGYGSHESFTRAFKEIWNCKPSEFRERKYAELFPKFSKPIEGDGKMKHVDISQLYDLFCERKNCYFVCCDIRSLVPINEISTKAGDFAILEVMNRMNRVAGQGDMVFRIGGDEFCMLTDSDSKEYAESIVEKILAYNGETIAFEGKEIPLSLYAVATKFEGPHMKYDELFTGLHRVISGSKK